MPIASLDDDDLVGMRGLNAEQAESHANSQFESNRSHVVQTFMVTR